MCRVPLAPWPSLPWSTAGGGSARQGFFRAVQGLQLKQWEGEFGIDPREVRSVYPPVVGDGRVIVGTAEGTLWCFDEYTGQKRWMTHAGARLGVCPVLLADAVVLGCADGSVRVLDARGGGEQTRVPLVEGDPIVGLVPWDDGLLAASAGGYLASLGPTSGLVWGLEADPPSTSAFIAASGPTAVVASASGLLVAVRPDGSVLWRFDGLAGGDIVLGPTIAEDSVIAGNALGALARLRLSDGSRAGWLGTRLEGECHQVYVVDTDRRELIVGTEAGRFVRYDLESGGIRDVVRLASVQGGDAAIVGLAADPGYVYAATSHGDVFALRRGTRAPRFLARLDGGIVAGPSLADGVLVCVSSGRTVHGVPQLEEIACSP